MRILSVRFKNLNSLTGEWLIDFSAPAYRFNGIFAITGPTGAGKTTILDAICLALYGCTPRLHKITQNDNEIMARQTGDCFAETTFSTSQGTYCCHWSQHRARQRPEGALQMPKQEIVDSLSGRVLATGLRSVPEYVEKVSGMDFERFTRSMLLAQGGFAAFLLAPPAERAPILEQITGSEIYSQISVRVHEKRSEERKRLESWQAELAGLQLLTPEQEQELTVKLQATCAEEVQNTRKADDLRRQIVWQQGILRLRQDLSELDQQWEIHENKQRLFAPDAHRLDQAQRALTLEGQYVRLQSLRAQQQEELQELQNSMRLLPDKQKALQSAEQTRQEAATRLEAVQSEQSDLTRIIKKVRELDLLRAGKQTRRDEMAAAVEIMTANCHSSQDAISKHQAELQETQNAREETGLYLQENHADASLAENLGAITRMFDALREGSALLTRLHGERVNALQIKQQCISTYVDADTAMKHKHSEMLAIQQQQEQLQQASAALLAGLEMGAWRRRLDDQRQRQHQLESALQAYNNITALLARGDELSAQAKSLSLEEQRLAAEIKTHTDKKDRREQEVQYLEIQAALLNRIHSLEEERARLEDGMPCPLCGATDHPYARGNIPALDQTEISLQNIRTELKTIDRHLSRLHIRQAETAKDLQQTRLAVKQTGEALQSEQKLCADILAVLALDCSPAQCRDLLDEELRRSGESVAAISEIIAKAEAQEIEYKKTSQALDTARLSWAQAQKAWQKATGDRDAAGSEYERLEKEYHVQRLKLDSLRAETLRELSKYGIGELADDSLPDLLQTLKLRRDKWRTAQDRQDKNERKLQDLQLKIENEKVLLERIIHELNTARQTYAEAELALQVLDRERYSLFADRDPDEEELSCARMVQDSARELEQARTDCSLLEQEILHLHNRITSLGDATRQRGETLLRSEQEWRERLLKTGFADEAQYLAACLPEEERVLLGKQAQTLQAEQIGLTGKRQEKSAALQAEESRMLTNEPYETLQQNLALVEKDLKEAQQEMGRLKNTLSHNLEQQAKRSEQLARIAVQKKVCEQWDALHQLIGSSDGRKYRNFAQGLTFEAMVVYANHQLRRMSDRYLLVRDKNQPLELNVIDNYQAGEVRSTRNLSGGETFIVSLALSLGLSQMASRNVQVDSLFLDEGFGTLDEDALDTALDTLGSLQQEGKLIGVISHVAALKDRISTQIEVIPQSGGRSIIVGPGCSKIGER